MKLVHSETPDQALLIEFSGEMDAAGCADIRPELEQILSTSEQKTVVLDLADVSFIDSSGIGVIVFLYKRFKSRSQALEIVNVQGQPRELIELLRIGSAIPVHMASNQMPGEKQCTA